MERDRLVALERDRLVVSKRQVRESWDGSRGQWPKAENQCGI
jgi:hypothetical protein